MFTMIESKTCKSRQRQEVAAAYDRTAGASNLKCENSENWRTEERAGERGCARSASAPEKREKKMRGTEEATKSSEAGKREREGLVKQVRGDLSAQVMRIE